MNEPQQVPAQTLRALLVGVELYRHQSGHAKRPGTLQALREIDQRFTHGGWSVRLLTDDASTAPRRSGLTQILEGLEWLREAEQSLVILSGHVKQTRFYPADFKPSFVAQSTLALSDLIEALSESTGLILDGALPHGLTEGLSWSIVASEIEADEPLFSAYGPTSFMHSIVVALNTWPMREELKVKSFFEAYQRGDPPDSAYHNYSSLESVSLLTPPPLGQVSFTPLVQDAVMKSQESGTSSHSGASSSSSAAGMSSSGSAHGGRFLANGRFQLLRILGEGGIGQVFLARDTRLKKYRAIKVLKIPDKLSDEQREHIRGRMIQSVKAAQELSEYTHNVVQVYEVGIDEETELPFMVMEYLEGVTLNRRLYSEPPLTLEQIFEIGLTLCETLAIAHQHNVIHRDLKPENVMLIKRGANELFVKLLDFDLVKVESGEVKTQEGQILGTLEYMSPEQLKGEEIDARADVFSLAAILYECFSGVRANAGKNQRQLVRVLIDQGIRPLEEVAPLLPRALCDLINGALSLAPDERPRDAQALAEALRPLQSLKSTLSTMTFSSTLDMKPTSSGVSTLDEVRNTQRSSTATGTLTPALEPIYAGESFTSMPITEDLPQDSSQDSSQEKTSARESDSEPYTTTHGITPQGSAPVMLKWGVLIFVLAFGMTLGLIWPTPPEEHVEDQSQSISDASRDDSTHTQIAPKRRDGDRSISTQAQSWRPLEDLSRLPTPSADWSQVSVTPESDPTHGLLWIYRGADLAERLGRVIFELNLTWREGDTLHEGWESEPLRWSLLNETPRVSILTRRGALAIPQAFRDELIGRRAQRQREHIRVAETFTAREGLIVLTPKECKLDAGDLITSMKWRIKGKRGLKQCEGVACLNAHQRQLKRKPKYMKMSLTLNVSRPVKSDEGWSRAGLTIKCVLK